MPILFKVLGQNQSLISPLRNLVELVPDSWDDYSFKTSFDVKFYNSQGTSFSLGMVKIGCKGQERGWTRDLLMDTFERLPDVCFSLGQDVAYYKSLYHYLTAEEREHVLVALRDVVVDESILRWALDERVFTSSLMRGVSLSAIRGQFSRVLKGEVELTDYYFTYKQDSDDQYAGVELDFKVDAASVPSTNVHVLIGRNGVGKTSLLNSMARALIAPTQHHQPKGQFLIKDTFGSYKLERDYFSSVVSVSFSAFDSFLPMQDRPDRSQGPAYFYVGMKNARHGQSPDKTSPPKTHTDLVNDLVRSFQSCLSQPTKRERWLRAIKRLESDVNFAEMDLGGLIQTDDYETTKRMGALAGRMSSGHSIVLLTITKLVDTVEEKTLVLLDEPESHLHPPLLSAFTRALSDLLHNRNGVAIIATHSPVVLQEVPRSCVLILSRTRAEARADRPERETFGENVGILTREVFGLEVSKSGFHELLQQSVNRGGSYEQILSEYQGNLGAEAKAILLSMIAARDNLKF